MTDLSPELIAKMRTQRRVERALARAVLCSLKPREVINSRDDHKKILSQNLESVFRHAKYLGWISFVPAASGTKLY